jgi:hypothetical protein
MIPLGGGETAFLGVPCIAADQAVVALGEFNGNHRFPPALPADFEQSQTLK